MDNLLDLIKLCRNNFFWSKVNVKIITI